MPPLPPDVRRRVFEMLAREANALHEFALRVTGDPNEAADVSQDALLKAMELADRVDPARRPAHYLRGIMMNLWRRRRAERRRTVDLRRVLARPSASPAEVAAMAEFDESVARALHRLPSSQREVIECRLSLGEGPEQIAKRLGRNPSTVRTQLHRGTAALRRTLAPAFLAMLVSCKRGTSSKPLTVVPRRAWPVGGRAAAAMVALVAALGVVLIWPSGASVPAAADPPEQPLARTDAFLPARLPVPSRAVPSPTENGVRGSAPASSLTVVARWQNGEPAHGVPIRLVNAQRRDARALSSGFVERRTDPRGEAVFTGPIDRDDSVFVGSYALEERLGEAEISGFGLVLPVRLSAEFSQRVRVIDHDGAPVAEACVLTSFDNASFGPGFELGQTDKDGNCTVPITTRRAFVWARSPSGDLSSSYRATGNDEIVIPLGEMPWGLVGVVTGVDGRPAAGAELVLSQRPFPQQHTVADAEGCYRFRGHMDRPLFIVARSADFGAIACARRTPSEEAERLDVLLQSTASVVGTVPGEVMASEVEIVAKPIFGPEFDEFAGLTVKLDPDANGAFEIGGLLPGDSSVGLWDRGRQKWIHTVSQMLQPGERAPISFVGQHRWLRGRVVEPDGAPAAGYVVRIWRSKLVAVQTTDANGRFAFELSPGQRHKVVVLPRSSPDVITPMPAAIRKAVVPSEAPIRIELRRWQGGVVGCLRPGPGALMPDRVRIAANGGRLKTVVRVAQDGRFAATNLMPLTYRVWLPEHDEPIATARVREAIHDLGTVLVP